MILSSFNGTRGKSAEHLAGTLNRVVSILLQGVALHGFQYERESFDRFQAEIRKVRSDFNEATDDDTALLLAGAAIRLMEAYSNESDRYLKSRRSETEAAIAHLTETLWDATGAAPEILVDLKEAERDFATAASPEDLAAARQRIAACVELGRLQAEAIKAAAQRALPPEHDSVTGLPDSRSATVALTSVWPRKQTFYAAIFALERLEAINLRFGFKVGDEVLLILSQHLANGIRPEDTLFRWRGPCLVALIDRPGHETVVASEISRLASARLEHTLRVKQRAVMVPLSISWNLLPLAPAAAIEDLLSGLNDFAAHRTRQLR